jgi:hypothetical protein
MKEDAKAYRRVGGGELGGLDMAYSAGHGPAAYVKALKPVNTSGGPEHLVDMRYPKPAHTYMRLHIYICVCVRGAYTHAEVYHILVGQPPYSSIQGVKCVRPHLIYTSSLTLCPHAGAG